MQNDLSPVHQLTLSALQGDGETHKCECCKKQRSGCEYQETGKYWLCFSCKGNIENRLKPVEKPKDYQGQGILLDEAELKGLRADGLLSLRTYVYLALRIEGLTLNPTSVDVFRFCNRWAVVKEDLISAAASLSKKGAIYLNIESLTAQVFTHEDRLKSLESSISNSGDKG